jgi:hypothetical protein
MGNVLAKLLSELMRAYPRTVAFSGKYCTAKFPLRYAAVRYILEIEPLGTVSPVAAILEPGLMRSAAGRKR